MTLSIAIQPIPGPAQTIFGSLIATQSQRNGTKKKVVILHLHAETTTKTNEAKHMGALKDPIANPYSATYGLCIPTWPMLD